MGQLTIAEIPKLDLRKLNKENLLSVESAFDWQLDFDPEEIVIQCWLLPESLYVEFNSGNSMGHQNINLATGRASGNGGIRTFAVCPICNDRFLVLYLRGFFACRQCHSLSYPSWKLVHKEQRAELRCDEKRKRLGWKPGLLNPEGEKPPDMCSRDFNSTVNEYRKCLKTVLSNG